MVIGGISGVIAPGGGTAHAAGGFAGGTGTASDPYQIATADQLSEVRNYLDPGLYFNLIADIDLSSYDNWMPIGVRIYSANSSSSSPFSGNMDGNGFKITNLKIDQPFIVFEVGLFGRSTGNITNMILEDIEVQGRYSSGGLLSTNYGTISNTYVTGRIVNGSAGLVNENYGTISNSYALVSITGNGISGGLVGSNYSNGIIKNSYATGSIAGRSLVGGLVARNDGTIINSYATGNVSGSNYYDMGAWLLTSPVEPLATASTIVAQQDRRIPGKVRVKQPQKCKIQPHLVTGISAKIGICFQDIILSYGRL